MKLGSLLLFIALLAAATLQAQTTNLIVTGVFDGPLGTAPRGMELYVIDDIADLSDYGIGSANNGEGTDGEEFTFPAVAASEGDFIYVTNDAVEFVNFFGFSPDYENAVAGINGNDAVEVFYLGNEVDIFGLINVDGTVNPGNGWTAGRIVLIAPALMASLLFCLIGCTLALMHLMEKPPTLRPVFLFL